MRAWFFILVMVGVTGVKAEPELLSPDAVNNRYAGYSVAIDGDLLLSGAPGGLDDHYPTEPGRVLPYQYNGANWRELSPVVPDEVLLHGAAVDMDGQWAVVGGPGCSECAPPTPGQVSVLRFDGLEWSIVARLHPSSAPSRARWFGNTVAISGTTIAVGGDSGTHIYEYYAPGDTWMLQTTITHPSFPTAFFTGSFSLHQDTLAIGQPYESSIDSSGSDGAVYIFKRITTGEPGGRWIFSTKITAFDHQIEGFFGSAVALFENSLIVGAPRHRGPSIPVRGDYMGQVYSYSHDALSDSWVPTSKLFPADRSFIGYGNSVAIDGNAFIVGATWTGYGTTAMSTFVDVYRRPSATGSWTKVVRESNPSPSIYENSKFGRDVDISGECAVVGNITGGPRRLPSDRPGAAHVFCDIPSLLDVARFDIAILCCKVPIDPMGPVVFEVKLAQYRSKINKRRIQVKLTTPHGIEAVLHDEWQESGGSDDPTIIKNEVSGNLLEAYGRYQLTVIATDEHGRSQLRHKFFQIGDVVTKE